MPSSHARKWQKQGRWRNLPEELGMGRARQGFQLNLRCKKMDQKRKRKKKNSCLCRPFLKISVGSSLLLLPLSVLLLWKFLSFFFLFLWFFFFLIAGFLLPQFALLVAGLEREFKQICGIISLIYLFNFRNYWSHCVRFPLVLCQFFGVAFIVDNNNTAS